MEFEFSDFNGAEGYVSGGVGTARWDELARVLSAVPLYLQPSEALRKWAGSDDPAIKVLAPVGCRVTGH